MADDLSDDTELATDGPWNMPAMLAAREHQRPVRIGGVPATAAVIGQPFLRGSRPHLALLITPVPGDQRDTMPLPDLRDLSTADQPPAEPEPSLFAELAGPVDEALVEKHRTRSVRISLLVTAAAFLLSVGIPVALHVSSPSTGRTSATTISGTSTGATAESAARTQLLSWARSNLPADSVIVTDPISRDRLRAHGFSHVLVFDALGDAPLPTLDYVLDVPGSDVPATGPGGRVSLVTSSQPLARFDTATARQFFPQPAGILSREQADARLRKQGGTELGRNPAVVPDPATRSVLAAGQLDLRAQNIVNLLATSGTVYLTEPALVPAEQRLGRPVRSIVVTTDSNDAVQGILAGLIAPYRPDRTVQLSPHKIRLTWNPAIAPVATVGQ